jgi:predicted nucleic acid-binding protein
LPDYRRCFRASCTYEQARIGFVDATVVGLAERLKISRMTTDRRDFSIVRPRHCKGFELLP